MIAKEEKHLVRFAIRHRWLSAEEGEDILFLLKKFGPKYSVVELIRQRQYLNDVELESLSAEAESDARRRQNRNGIFRLSALTARRSSSETRETLESQTRETLESQTREALESQTRETLESQTRETLESQTRETLDASSPKAPPRRRRRKLNALSVASRATNSPPQGPTHSSHPVAVESVVPEEDSGQTILMPKKPALGAGLVDSSQSLSGSAHTVVDHNLVEQLEALRSEVQFEDKKDKSNWPSIRPSHSADSEQNDEEEYAQNVKGTVTGVISESDLSARPAAHPITTADNPVPTLRSDDVTVALQGAVQRKLDDQLQDKTRHYNEEPITRSDVASVSVAVSSAHDPQVWEAKTSRDVPRRLVPAAPSVVYDALREPSGEPSPIRSRDDLHATLKEPLRSADSFKEGDYFGRYQIVRSIARGASSIVYLAKSIRDGHDVAIKVLKSELSSNPDFNQRFLHESQIAMSIVSPHVVKIYEVGEYEGQYFSVLQYVDGWSLQECLETGDSIELLEVLRITRNIAKALEATSAAGLVHRDVKPGNILIGRDGSVLLTDFGLALELDAKTLSAIGSDSRVVGSPAYMAPEQALGGQLDVRSDLYGLGATLFRVLRGQDVYPGSSPISVITKHISREPPELHRLNSHIPSEVSDLVLRLLAKSPDERFQSPRELGQTVESVIVALGPVKRSLTRSGEELADRFSLYKRASIIGLGGLLATLCLGLVTNHYIVDPIEKSNLVLNLSALAMANLLAAMFLFSGLGLIRRGELALPDASAILLKLKDLTGALGGACLWMALIVGPPSAIRILAGLLGVLMWTTLVYGLVLRRDIVKVRFGGQSGRTLAVLEDVRVTPWRRLHALMLVAVVAVSTVKYAFMKYFQASGLN